MIRLSMAHMGTSSRKIWKPFRVSNKMKVMARSVTISTPVPTLEEFGKSLGLSKTRQNSLLKLVRRDSVSGAFVTRRRDTSSSQTSKLTVAKK